MFGLFKKKIDLHIPHLHVSEKIDLSSLDASLELLQTTSLSVGQAALDAAKSLEMQLEDSEVRLYSIIDSINDFVCVKDGEGRYKIMNSFGESMYGWFNREYIGKTDYELIEEFPQFKDHLLCCVASDIQTWENKTPLRTEEFAMLGGKTQVFDVIKTPVFNEDGTKKELIIVGRNVTEVKAKNSRVKACFNALNAASDVIIICDGDGNIVFCNDKFLQKYGFHDHRDVVGKRMSIISSGKTQKEVYEDLWKTIKSGKVWSGVVINRTQKGTEVKCRNTILPVMNGRPNPIYYICTMHDANKDKTGR